jgi:NAD(P)-dependent dehydrogenase (short-subunit alcohol dehydrogenase family)
MEMLMNEHRKLTGKVAIVFGGSRGIGAAAARRLATDGADVALTFVAAPERAAETIRAMTARIPQLSRLPSRRPSIVSENSTLPLSTPAFCCWVTSLP